ncbi:MAG: FadR family transcriptional regulator [Myxococcales bacterium]|nr:FadR family transcriptional regulator [Myxococcales bacterium]
MRAGSRGRRAKRRAPGQSARAAVYEALLEAILCGELAPGERLPGERELSGKWRASRNTLREAIRRLEHARLVSTRHGQGVTVLDFRRTGTLELLGPFLQYGRDEREKALVLLDLLEPRLRLIEELVALAATRATKEDFAALEEAAARGEAAEATGEPAAVAAAQDLWLQALVDAAHSLPLRWAANPLLHAVRDLLERLPHLMPLTPSFSEYTRGVLDGLERGDVEAAQRALRHFHLTADEALRSAFAPAQD